MSRMRNQEFNVSALSNIFALFGFILFFPCLHFMNKRKRYDIIYPRNRSLNQPTRNQRHFAEASKMYSCLDVVGVHIRICDHRTKKIMFVPIFISLFSGNP